MQTELIISGKNNPHVVPDLTLWGFPISFYLFLGGLTAGILFFASLYYLLNKSEKYPYAVKWATFFAPPALIVGLTALFIDLHHKVYVWRLYTTINFDSPMSWGAWTLLIITPLSILWCISFLDNQPKLGAKLNKWLALIREWAIKYRKPMAWTLLILSVVLGVYTGILLSAFNARPLWNSSTLGFLFLISGLSTGAVLIMWLSRNKEEILLFRKLDMALIGIELLLIVHFFMGLLAGPLAQVQAAELFLGGKYTWSFWLLVVLMGLIIPLIIEFFEYRGKHVPRFLVPMLVLIGGLIFRIILVQAGQTSTFMSLA